MRLRALLLDPRFLAMPKRNNAQLGSFLVAEGTATVCKERPWSGQIHEERRQQQGIHSTRNGGRRLRHALPLYDGNTDQP